MQFYGIGSYLIGANLFAPITNEKCLTRNSNQNKNNIKKQTNNFMARSCSGVARGCAFRYVWGCFFAFVF